jgi:hypothetical protein
VADRFVADLFFLAGGPPGSEEIVTDELLSECDLSHISRSLNRTILPSSVAGVIAIVELNGGCVQSDMEQFFRAIDQSVPQITTGRSTAICNVPTTLP